LSAFKPAIKHTDNNTVQTAKHPTNRSTIFRTFQKPFWRALCRPGL
jgi:hypothetical protein